MTPPLSLCGELTIRNAAALHAQLREALDAGCHELLLDAVDDCDSAGVQLLLAARRSLQEQGLPLVIRAPSPALRECLRRYALEDLLPPA